MGIIYETESGGNAVHKVGDKWVFYWEKNRDWKAKQLIRLGYKVKLYSGMLANYYVEITGIDSER